MWDKTETPENNNNHNNHKNIDSLWIKVYTKLIAKVSSDTAIFEADKAVRLFKERFQNGKSTRNTT